jgi:hypothetical protein
MGGCTKLCLAAREGSKIGRLARKSPSFLEESGISQFIVISFSGNIRMKFETASLTFIPDPRRDDGSHPMMRDRNNAMGGTHSCA